MPIVDCVHFIARIFKCMFTINLILCPIRSLCPHSIAYSNYTRKNPEWFIKSKAVKCKFIHFIDTSLESLECIFNSCNRMAYSCCYARLPITGKTSCQQTDNRDFSRRKKNLDIQSNQMIRKSGSISMQHATCNKDFFFFVIFIIIYLDRVTKDIGLIGTLNNIEFRSASLTYGVSLVDFPLSNILIYNIKVLTLANQCW